MSLEGKARRFTLTVLGAAPVAGRQGACNDCGYCCGGCPLHVAGRGCSAYDLRPLQCRSFPLDQRDVDEMDGWCSYWFAGDRRATADEALMQGLFS